MENAKNFLVGVLVLAVLLSLSYLVGLVFSGESGIADRTAVGLVYLILFGGLSSCFVAVLWVIGGAVRSKIKGYDTWG